LGRIPALQLAITNLKKLGFLTATRKWKRAWTVLSLKYIYLMSGDMMKLQPNNSVEIQLRTDTTIYPIYPILLRDIARFFIGVENSHSQIRYFQRIGDEKFEHEPGIGRTLGKDVRTAEDVLKLVIVNFSEDGWLTAQEKVG
jgi:hypothetical protein